MNLFSGEECNCADWHGCIMQQSIVGMTNIQPYKFSDCSLNDYINEFRETRNMCLLNKPNEVSIDRDSCTVSDKTPGGTDRTGLRHFEAQWPKRNLRPQCPRLVLQFSLYKILVSKKKGHQQILTHR